MSKIKKNIHEMLITLMSESDENQKYETAKKYLNAAVSEKAQEKMDILEKQKRTDDEDEDGEYKSRSRDRGRDKKMGRRKRKMEEDVAPSDFKMTKNALDKYEKDIEGTVDYEGDKKYDTEPKYRSKIKDRSKTDYGYGKYEKEVQGDVSYDGEDTYDPEPEYEKAHNQRQKNTDYGWEKYNKQPDQIGESLTSAQKKTIEELFEKEFNAEQVRSIGQQFYDDETAGLMVEYYQRLQEVNPSQEEWIYSVLSEAGDDKSESIKRIAENGAVTEKTFSTVIGRHYPVTKANKMIEAFNEYKTNRHLEESSEESEEGKE